MLFSLRNMKFSSGEDIEASAKAVLAPCVITRSFNNKCDVAVSRLCGWTNFLKLARACHGRLTSNSGSVGTIFSQVQELKPQQPMLISNESDGLSGDVVVNVVALAPKRARLMLSVELKPKNLSARLLLHSMRFAKNSLDRKFKARICDLATKIETAHHASM